MTAQSAYGIMSFSGLFADEVSINLLQYQSNIMTPLAQLKDTQNILSDMHKHLQEGKCFSPFETMRIRKECTNLMSADPVGAHIHLAILELCNNGIDKCLEHFRIAEQISPNMVEVHLNKAIALIFIGDVYHAKEELIKSLSLSIEPHIIDRIAECALSLDDDELIREILEKAYKLHLSSNNIVTAAAHYDMLNADDSYADEILSSIVNRHLLTAHSKEITDDRFNEMKNLADKLTEYM